MLLLPLLFYWARSPMYFSTPVRNSCIAAIFGICFAAPPSSLLLAADGYGDSATPVPASAPASLTPSHAPPIVRGESDQLREGTAVSELTGRFLLIGRRWAFLPDRPPVAPAEPVAAASNSSTRSMTRYTETRIDGRQSVRVETSTAQTSSPSDASSLPAQPSPLPQLLVVENLMLQRVVEAIRATPSDDRWTVSGEVVEFFDDNGLLLRTVQRAAMVDE